MNARSYFGARYYRAEVGRFTTVDPVLDQQAALMDPQRWNRYAYALNNPLKYTDPDGRMPWPLIAQWAQRVLSSPTVQRAGTWAQTQGVAAWNWATRVFNSPAGQEAVQTVAELATGAQAPTISGNLSRLSQGEMDTGLLLAQKLGQSIRVSEHVGAEFVSAAGKTFDALGTPAAYRFWNEAQFLSSIDKHLLKSNDFSVIDLTGASKSQIASIQKHVGSLAKALQDKVIYLGQ